MVDVSDRTQSSRHIPCAVHRIPLRIRRSRTAHGVCLLLLSETSRCSLLIVAARQVGNFCRKHITSSGTRGWPTPLARLMEHV